MYTIRNAAPRAILRGIKDMSGREPVYEPEMIPTHLPHVFLFAERGPTMPQLVSGDEMIRIYGAKTFSERGRYTTHQTILANMVNAEGNRMMVQRIVPPKANPPATLRLSLDIVPDKIEQYERATDGKFMLDENDNKIPTGEKVDGYRIRWVVGPTYDETDGDEIDPQTGVRLLEDSEGRLMESGLDRILQSSVGDGRTTVGEMVNDEGEQSTLYPIMDFEVTDFGSYGNRMGIRISAPTTESDIPVDDDLIEKHLAYLFRIQFVERDEDTGNAKVIENLWGERSVDFSFKEGVVNTRTATELFIDDIVIPSYSQEAAAGLPEIRPPFGRIHTYWDNLEAVLEKLHAVEHEYGLVDPSEEAKYMVNFFTAKDHNAVPYYAIKVMGPSDGGDLLTDSSTHYAHGGFDGELSYETFDQEVRYQLENYGDLEAKFLDSAIYPQSVLYDTGFTMETKKAFFVPMGRRKDLYAVVSTQDVTGPQNSPSEESSIAVALRTAARMYPESVIYGTPTARAIVHGHSGYLINSQYKGLLPLTLEFAQKCARYMGAAEGRWTNGNAFDAPPNNMVRLFKGVNADFKTANVRGRDWDNGLVWVQNYDRRSLFWPGVQTVYDDDSSVLNAAANMFVAVELQKVAERVWRDLSGISYLTAEQFIERSDRLIEERTRGRFDSRVIIVPETFYTQDDEQRGFSWSCNIHMYAPNMRTVGTFTVVAHRIEDYEGE